MHPEIKELPPEGYRDLHKHPDGDLGNGYSLGWTVGSNGDAWPILYDHNAPRGQWAPCTMAEFVAIAPHEIPGYRHSIDLESAHDGYPECGRITRDGALCRSVVRIDGTACRHHAGQPPAPEGAGTATHLEEVTLW